MRSVMRKAVGLGVFLAAAGAMAAVPANAQSPRFVREYIAETQGILAETEVARKKFEVELGDADRPARAPAGAPGVGVERFQKSFGGTMEKLRGRVKKLNESRQRAERTLSPKEAQFTGEVQGDLMNLMQRMAMSQLLVTEPPPRRAAFFEEIGKQAEVLRRKLQAYQ